MARKHNTDKDGNSWSEEFKKAIWSKGRTIPNYSADVWRWDKCGSVIKWSNYGDRDSNTGWEIDHVIPIAENGDDKLTNLQPLNWKNNANKGDKLDWTCP